jgi:hypothetical protein
MKKNLFQIQNFVNWKSFLSVNLVLAKRIYVIFYWRLAIAHILAINCSWSTKTSSRFFEMFKPLDEFHLTVPEFWMSPASSDQQTRNLGVSIAKSQKKI